MWILKVTFDWNVTASRLYLTFIMICLSVARSCEKKASGQIYIILKVQYIVSLCQFLLFPFGGVVVLIQITMY